jgi:hypothetical protein
MKVKEITVGMSYTYQAAPYHSVKGEASMTVELDENDDMAVVEPMVREGVLTVMLSNLAGVSIVHDKIYTKGMDPLTLLADTTEEEIEEDDWNGV